MRIKNLRFILQGLATYFPFKIPFLPHHQTQFIENRVRDNSDYKALARACYTNWLRFLVATKPSISLPVERVGEIGPGDCLGVGLCALLCGVKEYYPIDAFPHSRNCDNRMILDELVNLFKNKTPIPNDDEFPKAIPKLQSYNFPEVLTDKILSELITEERVEKIRKIIIRVQEGEQFVKIDDMMIQYPDVRKKPELDLLFSIAVMEHIDNPDEAYKRDYEYLKKGGIFAHTLGLNAHGTAWQWNGYFTYSPFVWKLIKGRARYLINRWPHSWHIRSLIKNGFKIVVEDTYKDNNTLSRNDIDKKFKDITDQDLNIYSSFISGYKM